MTRYPAPPRVPVSRAREELSAIVLRVQDPTEYCVLTRHGKPVAAVVSMASLKRIWRDEDADRWSDKRKRPVGGLWRPDGTAPQTDREHAEMVREVQLTRWQERRVLESQGMEVLEGGELMAETVVPVEVGRKRGWWRFGR